MTSESVFKREAKFGGANQRWVRSRSEDSIHDQIPGIVAISIRDRIDFCFYVMQKYTVPREIWPLRSPRTPVGYFVKRGRCSVLTTLKFKRNSTRRAANHELLLPIWTGYFLFGASGVWILGPVETLRIKRNGSIRGEKGLQPTIDGYHPSHLLRNLPP